MHSCAIDRNRLAKVLGLLGSDHPGERDAAALAAMRLVRDAGLTWTDILVPVSLDRPRSLPAAASDEWQDDLNLCIRNRSRLSDWEAQFCSSLMMRRLLTPAQSAKLRQIAPQLRERGAG